jgi:hypothetical protein
VPDKKLEPHELLLTTHHPPLTTHPSGNPLQLVLGTGAFAVCFAIFGSVSAMMPQLRVRLILEPIQISVALALPVLLGSLGRIPLGILTDRYGGRIVFIAVLVASILPAVLMGFVEYYWQLLVCGFFVGIALASFSVGVGFVSGGIRPSGKGLCWGFMEPATSANRGRHSALHCWSCSWGMKPGDFGHLPCLHLSGCYCAYFLRKIRRAGARASISATLSARSANA